MSEPLPKEKPEPEKPKRRKIKFNIEKLPPFPMTAARAAKIQRTMGAYIRNAPVWTAEHQRLYEKYVHDHGEDDIDIPID